MRRQRQLCLWAICFVIALSGCQRTEITKETLVNEKDPKQVLKLESVPSLKIDLIGRFHNVEAAGNYTLQAADGTVTGTYTYIVDSKKGLREYVFHPKEGERWEATLDSRGSFTDGKGGRWRIQKVTIDEAKVVQKTGG